MSTLCLSMIVKNESHCVEECLKSVRDIISYWVICDTGSSDNTEEVVRKALNGIPGEYHNHKWKDFSYNRNLALSLSRKHCDYSFFMDADDVFVKNNKNLFDNLDSYAYRIKIRNKNGSEYSRIQLLNNTTKGKFVGVLHENLSLEERSSPALLNECHINHNVVNGARSLDPDKYFKDAQILEDQIKKNPNDARSLFYCAQTYKELSKFEEAINLYLRRVNLGGWEQEVYASLLNIAKLTNLLYPEDKLSVMNNYIRCYNFNPNRVESLVYLSSYCRSIGLFDHAYMYSKIGIKIAKPHDVIYLESDCYDWRIHDELSVAAYFVGNKKEAKTLSQWLLSNKFVPDSEKDRISKNISLIN